MEPPQEEKYKIKYNGKDKEIEVIYEDVKEITLKKILENEGIFEKFGIIPDLVEIKNKNGENILNKEFTDFDLRDENQQIVLNITNKEKEEEKEEKKKK